MIHRIVYFLFPWELDDFQRHVNLYLIAVNNFKNNDKDDIIFDITLDVSDDNLVDWNKSKLPKSFFVDKFIYFISLLERYYKVEYNLGENIKGCSDARRAAGDKEYDIMTWVDPDMFFPPSILSILYYVSKKISTTHDYFIVTPTIIKYWDQSWDVITSSQFMNEDYEFRLNFDSYVLGKDLYSKDDIIIQRMSFQRDGKEVPVFKFFGGMFPTFSKAFYSKYPIPKELCPYGGQDTFLMFSAMHNAYSDGIFQYKIDSLIVSENFTLPNKVEDGGGVITKTDRNYIRSHLHLNDKLRKRKYNVYEIEEMVRSGN